ncbi:hypothetical protein [Sphingomonas oligoaromativorans]|uniref:hypothetical protein n=1 Tax=Sphingomonas oligoaromativorans TaxID=575322 RepID=UPI00142099CB|nr:hypothetical protein [Sphingomonas oligoaromativorans]NIJ34310.1 hypothetical protein [Sphingomonas oligoaromativorans]
MAGKILHHLIPRFERGRWGGPGVDEADEFDGFHITIQWLGLIAEIGLGRIC